MVTLTCTPFKLTSSWISILMDLRRISPNFHLCSASSVSVILHPQPLVDPFAAFMPVGDCLAQALLSCLPASLHDLPWLSHSYHPFHPLCCPAWGSEGYHSCFYGVVSSFISIDLLVTLIDDPTVSTQPCNNLMCVLCERGRAATEKCNMIGSVEGGVHGA